MMFITIPCHSKVALVTLSSEYATRATSGGCSWHRADTQGLQRELSGLSERYSHKCLELNRAQQEAAEREREMSRRERDLDLLRKENQVRLE